MDSWISYFTCFPGAHMKLTDMRWAVSVERCLGNLMLSFTCHDHHDEIMLEKIFRKHLGKNRKPSIITSHFLVSKYSYRLLL